MRGAKRFPWSPHGPGEHVRLIGEKKEGIHEVLEVAAGKFRTDFVAGGDQGFVFGREVKDFRSVDYEAISMLNVSATQELARKQAASDAEIARLRPELTQLRTEKSARVVSLEQDVADLKKLVAQLAQAGKAGKQAAVAAPQGVAPAKVAWLQAPSATASQER